MNTNENSIFIENLQVQNTHSFNDPFIDINERIPLDKQEVWINRSLIPSIPPSPAIFPGGAISGPVRGISGVLLTSLNSSPRQFKYQGAGTQQFANMVPASYFNDAYRPTLRDSKGKVVPYNPNVWVADGLLSIVEFKSDTPVSLGYLPPFTIDYWQYIGPVASSWSSGGNVELDNLGTGTQIYNSSTESGLRSITTGSGLTAEVTPDDEMINFENTLTAVNKGNGVGIFINKTDNNLNFRSLLSSENNITFVGNSDNIDININTIPLAKLANIPANTILGNNNISTLGGAVPKALKATEVKKLLSLDDVANININTWNGSTFINTLGTINTLNAGTLNVSSAISSTGGLGSSLRLSANVEGFIICESKLRVSDITNNGPISIIANRGASDIIMACPLDMSTNDIKNASSITSQTMTCDTITCNTITSEEKVVINNKVVNGDSDLTIDGLTSTKSRQIICKQNNVSQCSFGLTGSTNFFVKDLSTSPTANLLELTLGTAGRTSALKLPTYTSNGLLRITDGLVSVDSNFSNNTSLVIDGPIVAEPKQIVCKQNNVQKCNFGLSGIDINGKNRFFVQDTSTTPVQNLLELVLGSTSRGNTLRLPSYSTDGLLRIDGGIVTVESTISTTVNTLDLKAGDIDGESSLNINGTTTTKNRQIICQQNDIDKCSFGLSGSTNFFVQDLSTTPPQNLLELTLGTTNRATALRLPTYANGTLSIITTGEGTSNEIKGIVSNTSDRRLKKNEETLISAESLQKIMNLQPKKYCWKSDSSNRVKIGFIAQDVELEIPEAVDGKKYEYEFIRDGVSQKNDGTVCVDENGDPLLNYDQPRYRGLDQCAILSTLVSAVQELTNQLNNLTTRLDTLESKL